MNKNFLFNKFTLSVICFVVLNLVALFFLWKQRVPPSNVFCRNYPLLNQDLNCNYKNVIDKKEYSDLKSRLFSFIEKSKQEKKASLVAVWFRDLEYGPTFGINDRIDFIPASLLKVPLAMTYFEMSENDPKLLKVILRCPDTNSAVPNQIITPSKSIIPGRMYSIEELIEYTLVYSDNNAAQLLFDYLNEHYPNQNLLAGTLRDLGILGSGSDVYLSAVNTKEYGSIFRLLFNASFLNKEASDKILSMLARSEFNDGIKAGVPEDTIVAHKFGERYLNNGEKQLHDCGIVYYPENPYLLCVMTRGTNYNDLKTVIKEISKEVYKEFDSRKIE